MVQALRRLLAAIAVASGLGITGAALAAPTALAAPAVHVVADDDDDDRPRGGVDTGMGGAAGLDGARGVGVDSALQPMVVAPLALAGTGILLAGGYLVSRRLGRV
ncbi:hypothetical protein [Nonomuraea sp. LPB2021202275-12-8]|uniref:hypothetical protein n=1 Tax=Nonomuraea sp. LPB2021202275-12-8 TaxID=3120159 RepID=UPI00300CD9C2